MNHTLTVEPTGENRGHCDCCGNASCTIWGYVHEADRTIAAYFVHWTSGSADHMPNIDFLIGTWGDDNVNDRVLSSWLYSPSHNSFMIIDAAQRPAARSELCSHALSRDETLSMPDIRNLAASCLDAVWLQDQRMMKVCHLAGDDA